MRTITLLSVVLLLSSCAAQTSLSTGQPLNQTQVQADLANAQYILKVAGCAAVSASAIAAPIISIAGDPAGGQVLTAVSAAGEALCATPIVVPPTALPVPAPANAPAASAPLAVQPSAPLKP
jgi:hypothetical protein